MKVVAGLLPIVASILMSSRSHAQVGNDAWTMVDSLTERISYRDIDCADPEHCIAIGGDGTTFRTFLRKTTDGGRTWATLAKEASFFDDPWYDQPWGRYGRVAHPTPDRIVVIAVSGWVLNSADGGATWSKEQLSDTVLSQLHFLDGSNGVLSGDGLHLTSDGGSTWQSLNVPKDTANLIVGDVFMPQSNVIVNFSWGRGRSVFTLRSENLGEDWRVGQSIDGFRAACFVDDQRGWIVAYERIGGGQSVRDIVYRTTDGGITWPIVHNSIGSPAWDLLDVDFADSLNGVAGGFQSKLRIRPGNPICLKR